MYIYIYVFLKNFCTRVNNVFQLRRYQYYKQYLYGKAGLWSADLEVLLYGARVPAGLSDRECLTISVPVFTNHGNSFVYKNPSGMVYGRVGHIYRPRPSTGSVISESTDARTFLFICPRFPIVEGNNGRKNISHILITYQRHHHYHTYCLPTNFLMRIT